MLDKRGEKNLQRDALRLGHRGKSFGGPIINLNGGHHLPYKNLVRGRDFERAFRLKPGLRTPGRMILGSQAYCWV